MGVNFSSYEIGRRAIRAGNFGTQVAGQNIANVNTVGYTRKAVQQIQLGPASATVSVAPTGGGVTIDNVRSFRDKLVESRLQTETAISGRLTAQRDALTPVDSVLSDPTEGGGIQQSLSAFFSAFGDLEAHPTSVPLREAAITRANDLGASFAATRQGLVDIRSSADGEIRSSVDAANGLSSQVAELNDRIARTTAQGGNAEELVDQRQQAVQQLADLVGARTTENGDGTISLSLADGSPLVIGRKANALQVVDTPPNGLASVTLDGRPAQINEGRVKGLTDAIAQIGDHVASLDALADSVATRTNAAHQTGSDLDGNAGGVFFAVPASGPNTAATLHVDATVKANPRLVVASATGAGAGDGSVARSISNLLNDPTTTAGSRTGSFGSIYASVVSDAGNQIKSLDDSLATQQAVLSQTQAQRDSLSGVSLDEEAVNLLQYQRAYEAAAKFLKVADEMTQAILALGQ